MTDERNPVLEEAAPVFLFPWQRKVIERMHATMETNHHLLDVPDEEMPRWPSSRSSSSSS